VEALRSRGAVFVDELDQAPEGALVVFSAHGVSPEVERAAQARGMDVLDATCPLVQRVHREGRRYVEAGFEVILIGHEGHAEVEGTKGQVGGGLRVVSSAEQARALEARDPSRLAYITQTTLSVFDTRDVIAALKARFPAIVGPDTRDICYATQNRQKAVLDMAGQVDLVLVLGSANSSNSNRLREMGLSIGVPAHLVESGARIRPEWLDGVDRVGLTAGASAPETLVRDAIEALRAWRPVVVQALPGVEETVQFRLPQRLQDDARRRA
jgi:4-hydroxy-3-methylbut-2-enyl diphosphate reductase